jgi:DNA invertase Pin-like site-specific DNA recombinase
MTGKRVGYIRVSDASQNEGRQLEDQHLDKSFTDKVSGKNTNRPALVQMLEYVREGDTLLVHSIDRLARNLVDLRNLVDQLTGKGVAVCFIKENLTFTADTANPMNNLMLSMMGAFAEFERSMIRERQREGITLAKAEGRMTGRPAALTVEQVKTIKERAEKGESKVALAAEFSVTRATIYSVLKAAA